MEWVHLMLEYKHNNIDKIIYHNNCYLCHKFQLKLYNNLVNNYILDNFDL